MFIKNHQDPLRVPTHRFEKATESTHRTSMVHCLSDLWTDISEDIQPVAEHRKPTQTSCVITLIKDVLMQTSQALLTSIEDYDAEAIHS